MRTALIDGDILLYEVGYSSQKKEGGFIVPLSWDFCQDLFDFKINLIRDETQSDNVIIFLNNTPFINRFLNKRRRWEGEDVVDYIPNFRELAAVTKGYKQGRAEVKPVHYNNLQIHILSQYSYHVNEIGLESDDAMCVFQMNEIDNTIICSRDKDVRQCAGWHYSWECGKQTSIGPYFVVQPGMIELHRKPNYIKIFGYGNKFFYSQLLTGDAVDTVGGAKGIGPVTAYDMLKDIETEEEMKSICSEAFKEIYKDSWKEKIQEQADLLWMVREIKDGKIVRWQLEKHD